MEDCIQTRLPRRCQANLRRMLLLFCCSLGYFPATQFKSWRTSNPVPEETLRPQPPHTSAALTPTPATSSAPISVMCHPVTVSEVLAPPTIFKSTQAHPNKTTHQRRIEALPKTDSPMAKIEFLSLTENGVRSLTARPRISRALTGRVWLESHFRSNRDDCTF